MNEGMTTESKSMTLAGVKVGDELVAYTPGVGVNLYSPWVVTEVGKKFVTAKNDMGSVAMFSVEDGRKKGSYPGLYAQYVRTATADDYLRLRASEERLRIRYFVNSGESFEKLSLDQLKRITALIDEFEKPNGG